MGSQRICHRSSEVVLPERVRSWFTPDRTPTSCAVLSDVACSDWPRLGAADEMVTNPETEIVRERRMQTMITRQLQQGLC
jgi:hypothetical protein